MNLTGTYSFYQAGRLVGRSHNLITDEGRLHIMRYLASQEPQIAGSMAVGVGESSPTVADSRLTYEFNRSTIYLTSPDYINKEIVFKTTLPDNLIGTIYEVGIFSTDFGAHSTGAPARSLAIFERGSEYWSNGEYVSSRNRLGFESLRLAPAASGTLTSVLDSVGLDLSSYSNTDEISVAFYVSDQNASTVRLRLRGVDPAAYYEYSVSSPSLGYNVATFKKGDMVKTGILDFSYIDSIEVSVSAKSSGSVQVDFDGIRIERNDIDTGNILVSRSVLSSPIVKTVVGEMDIEYALGISL